MKYADAFEIARHAIAHRKSLAPVDYPSGAARVVALAMVEAGEDKPAIADAAGAAMRLLESSNRWDGSIA